MNLGYKLNRFYVRIKLNHKANKYRKAIAKLNREQLEVFNYIMTTGKINSTNIMFDPEIEETLIFLPEILVTITKYKILIDNTHGFMRTDFPNDAYEIMENFLKKEGHRVRRKLKHEVKLRKRAFITDILPTINIEDNNGN